MYFDTQVSIPIFMPVVNQKFLDESKKMYVMYGNTPAIFQ